MHIVLDARFFRRSTGGIGRYTRSLIRELSRLSSPHRYTVLLTPADQADWDKMSPAWQLDPAQWSTCVTNIDHYTTAEQTRLPAVLRRLKPDLVHFLNFNHPLLWNQPFVITMYDLTIYKFPVGPKQQSWIRQTAFRLTLGHAVLAARQILTLSENSKDDFIRELGAKPAKVTVTYGSVDPEYRPINLPQRGRLRRQFQERYGIRPPYILFVSQWRPHKGIHTIIRAFELLRDQYPRLRPQLVLVGKPQPSFPEIPALIAASPYLADIVRPGFVSDEDLPKLYQAAEVFVFASKYEGFGIPPLEAMASGTPVVASRASCLPEILGSAAQYATLDDPAAWATSLHEVLTSKSRWQEMRTAGLAHVRRYSWQRMAEETLAVYDTALE